MAPSSDTAHDEARLRELTAATRETRARLTASVRGVEQRLDLGSLIGRHPLPAIAAAAVAGVLLGRRQEGLPLTGAAAERLQGIGTQLVGRLDAALAEAVGEIGTIAETEIQGAVERLIPPALAQRAATTERAMEVPASREPEVRAGAGEEATAHVEREPARAFATDLSPVEGAESRPWR